MAEEATKSWCIQSETRDRLKDRENVDLVTTYWVHVPLCRSCHRHWATLWWLFWIVGVMGGIVACGLFAHYWAPDVDRVQQQLDALAIGVSLLVLFTVIGSIAWGIAYVLHEGFINCPLAIYKPSPGRIAFGNKQYQQLYDRANQFLNTRPNRLGV